VGAGDFITGGASGCWRYPYGWFGYWDTSVALGNPESQGAPLKSFAVFQNVTIPQGATITAAYWTFYGDYGSSTGVVNARWFGNDVDNAVPPASASEADALELTTAAVDQEPVPPWAENDLVNGPDIKTIIQEIVDRPGWASGNALSVIIRDSDLLSDAYATRRIRDDAELGWPLVLHVEWTGGNEPEGIICPPLTSHTLLTALVSLIQVVHMTSHTLLTALVSLIQVVHIPAFLSLLTLSAQVSLFRLSDYLLTYECAIKSLNGEIIIPIESFQGYFRAAAPSYLSVVIPGLTHETALAAAVAAGSCTLSVFMIQTYKSGNRIRELVQTVDIDEDSVRIDEGATNQSISLFGYRMETRDPKLSVLGSSFQKLIRYSSDGIKYSYQCVPDLFIRAGDTVRIDSQEFTAGSIRWEVNTERSQMTVEPS
jgi:hypothetical protein